MKFGILNGRRSIIIIIKTNDINDFAAQNMVFKVLTAELVVWYLLLYRMQILFSVSLAVVKVDLFRLLDHINVFKVLVLEARDLCTVIRLTKNIPVHLDINLLFQF